MCQDKADSALILTAAGAVRRVDTCMRSLLQFLNDRGIRTFDSCCGHGQRFGHVTIDAADVESARGLGFRVCTDVGASTPEYPFTGTIDGRANLILPPVLLEESRIVA